MNSVEQIIHDHNRICWYPSAGADFRELLFLSKQFCAWKDVPIAAHELPDLFILTDCNPSDTPYGYCTGDTYIEQINGNSYDKMKYLFKAINNCTVITVNDKVEFVEKLDVQFNQELYKFDVSDNYGKAFYFSVHIASKQLGEWDVNVLYILVENTSFAFDYLVKNNVTVDYIVKVRYGDQFGESNVSGDWLAKLLKPLKTKYYLRNAFSLRKACDAIVELKDKFPTSDIVNDDVSTLKLEQIYRVNGSLWSGQGDIYWYKVKS
ncbi:MAG: hypothetical protein IKJ73_10925 [Lachnospiraceae bacterium]|nr:hypothetical protein [Lachnospiraceae bacterium]